MMTICIEKCEACKIVIIMFGSDVVQKKGQIMEE